MKQFVEVVVNVAPVDRSYHYSIPEELEGQVLPGSLVEVSFNNRKVQGVVLGFVEKPEVPDPLEILALHDESALLTQTQLDLANWMADRTFAPLSSCVRMMIPVGLSQQADIVVSIANQAEPSIVLSKTQARLVSMLTERGALRGNQLERSFGPQYWRGALKALKTAGIVNVSPYLPPPGISPKMVRTAQLTVLPDDVAGIPDSDLSKIPAVAVRRRMVLEVLSGEAFPLDFSWIYAQTQATYADLKALAELGFLFFNETESWRDPLIKVRAGRDVAPTLTVDQTSAWNRIQDSLKDPESPPILLHGVTGSGKTEIYMKALDDVLSQGKQALVMVPEIAMTPQTVRRFMARFPNQVGLYHSGLSTGERYDTWRRVRNGRLAVIVGTRSALFLPFVRLGLVVLDECDNESFDETEREPFYHSVETATHLTELFGAQLLLGSATPRITQFFNAQRGVWQLVELPRRILAHRDTLREQALVHHLILPDMDMPLLEKDLPKVDIVDMRAELRAHHTHVLSRLLRDRLKEVLDHNQQAILFLNRKGSATYVFCRQCGEALRCPREGMPLVFHGIRSQLVCHTCGYTRLMPKKCPDCGSDQIKQLGLGTEKLEELVKEAFPQARILRWDAETAAGKGNHDLILSHFVNHRADVLIGTQMVSKSLDLPLVTLVGIVLAEVGLNLPDYRAAERTFQTLTQVAGRAGRSPLGGEVVLQTYQPDHYVIQLASKHDYTGFFEKELGERKKLRLPPYSQLIRLEYRHFNEQRCISKVEELAGILENEIKAQGKTQTDFIGPTPCYYPKLQGLFRWQLILRGPDPLPLLQSLPLKDWKVEVDPPNLL